MFIIYNINTVILIFFNTFFKTKKNIGIYNENFGTVVKPYSLPLSLDYIDFDSKIIKIIIFKFHLIFKLKNK